MDNTEFKAGTTVNGADVSVVTAPSSALDGAPYAVWAVEGAWLVAIESSISTHLIALENDLPSSDVRRIIALWAISLAEDMEMTDDNCSW